MGSRKIIMLVGSILIGALAGFALLNYVNGVEQDVRQETQRVEVWVISADVDAGTTAADVQGTNRLEIRQVESQFRPANAISDLSQIQGRIAVNNLAANQILVQGMFDDPEAIETTFADLIEPDQIAFSITIDASRAVAGFVEPGDFVDIIHRGTYTPDLGADDTLLDLSAEDSPYTRPARFLFRGVRIIGIGDEFVGQAVDTAVPAAAEEERGQHAVVCVLLCALFLAPNGVENLSQRKNNGIESFFEDTIQRISQITNFNSFERKRRHGLVRNSQNPNQSPIFDFSIE